MLFSSSFLPPWLLLHTPLHQTERCFTMPIPSSEKKHFLIDFIPAHFSVRKILLGSLEINLALLIDPVFLVFKLLPINKLAYFLEVALILWGQWRPFTAQTAREVKFTTLHTATVNLDQCMLESASFPSFYIVFIWAINRTSCPE